MPLPIIAEGIFKGPSAIPYLRPILRTSAWVAGTYFLKRYFGGAVNRSERNMHSKVIMITGGTSGVGASLALQLSERGAQIILLIKDAPSDPFIVDFVEDLRNQSRNELIYAEQVDLSSLHSIRLFATKWVDNAPPRRLDMVILCAATMTPRYSPKRLTYDGVEENWGVNYLANFHLLSILSPAIRAQPPDRDVRIIMATCSSYIGAQYIVDDPSVKKRPFLRTKAYAASKMALMMFANSFQKHLDAYERPDKQPNSAKVFVVDPGWTRSPGMRRWLSFGTLWGLLLYIIMWPLWWLVLKSPDQGSQSFAFAAMDGEIRKEAGGKLIKECREMNYLRPEVRDDKLAEELWKTSEKQIEELEKKGAVARAKEKKAADQSASPNGAADSAGALTEATSSGRDDRTQGSRRSRKENKPN